MNGQQPFNRPRKGGSFIFIVVAICVMFLIQNQFNQGQPNPKAPNRDQGNANPNQVEIELPAELEPLKGRQAQDANRNNRSSDWGMEDVATQKDPNQRDSGAGMSSASTPTNRQSDLTPRQDKVQNGDWGMEDVATQSKGLTTKQPAPTAAPKTSGSVSDASQGDWAIEDVKTKKKVQNGDWGLEDIKPKKKNQ